MGGDIRAASTISNILMTAYLWCAQRNRTIKPWMDEISKSNYALYTKKFFYSIQSKKNQSDLYLKLYTLIIRNNCFMYLCTHISELCNRITYLILS